VFEYRAVQRENAERHEEGTIVARNKFHALDLLQRQGLVDVRLKTVRGFTAFIRELSASIGR